MDKWKYYNYLSVSEDFIPVFNEETDRVHRSSWKAFIPHEQMQILLEKLCAALDRERKDEIKSFWLTGAYGTGKTYASFVIKHILEDDLVEVEEYFNKYDRITYLWNRFKTLREKNGNFVVVYRSGSGYITSDRRFLMELQQSIIERMKQLGYETYVPGIIDQMVEKLAGEESIINWDNLFAKYRGLYFRDAKGPEDIVDALKKRDPQVSEKVAKILENENIALADTPAAVKEWLKEVIRRNNIAGIVFIWDEFTEYFNLNRNVTTLQELAHATQEIPFYLLLITHRALNQFKQLDDDNRKKLQDRFHNCRLEMEEVTAYTLLGNAINVISHKVNEWDGKREILWQQVERIFTQIMLIGADRLKRDELKRLIPIHPYTAYVLSHISKFYSSSQRTIFNFLKSDEEGGFQWFIKNYPVEEQYYWLTVDYLWQYFFENKDNLMELNETLTYVISYYENVKDKITDQEELKVLRAILLMIALSKQQIEGSQLYKPLLSNLKIVVFRGTFSENQIENIVKKLEEKRIILVSDMGNDIEFLLPGGRIDDNIYRKGEKYVEQNKTFEKVIVQTIYENGLKSDLEGLFSFTGASKLRFSLQILSANELKRQGINKISGTLRAYQIRIGFVVACNEEDLYNIDEIAERLSFESGYCIIVSERPFGNKRWAAWSQHCISAYCYDEMKDAAQKRYHENEMQKLSKAWLDELRVGEYKIFYKDLKWNRIGINAIYEILEEIRDIIFPYGPEKISTVNTLYDRGFGVAVAKIGVGIEQAGNPYKIVVDELTHAGLWNAKDLANYDKHPLGKMQRIVDEFFQNNDKKVRIIDLWHKLQEPPIGLMPSPMGLLIFARVMRKYIEGYYLYEGNNPHPLNPDKLAEILNHVVKEQRPAEFYYIHHMTPEGEAFCELIKYLFNLPPEKTSYPEEARKNMRERLQDLGYPLWTVIYVQETEDKNLKDAIDALQRILSYEKEELKEEEMREIISIVEPQAKKIASVMVRNMMEQGMNRFLDVNEPKLRLLSYELNISYENLREKLRKLLEEDVYLWKEERVKEKLPEIIAELKLIRALNLLCGCNAKEINEAIYYFKETWFKSKLPISCFKRGQPIEIMRCIDFLETLTKQEEQIYKLIKDENVVDEIVRNSDKLKEILKDNISLIICLVEEYTGQKITFDDAKKIYDYLSSISYKNEAEVRSEIERAILIFKHNKAIEDLEKKWEDITGSVSPDEWSETNKVPIQWVLSDQEFIEFFNKYKERHRLNKEDIEKMIQFLEEKRDNFAFLDDKLFVLKKFVEIAAGEYAFLVEDNMVKELQNYVFEKMGADVDLWVIQHNRVTNLVRKWINDNYRKIFYRQVKRILDSVSSSKLRKVIHELAANDSLVGMKLLTALSKKRVDSNEGIL